MKPRGKIVEAENVPREISCRIEEAPATAAHTDTLERVTGCVLRCRESTARTGGAKETITKRGTMRPTTN